MMAMPRERRSHSPEVEAFLQRLTDTVRDQRVPELFSPHPRALYQVENRHGVSTVVARTRDLPEEHLLAVLRYQMVQYLLLDHAEPQLTYEAGIEHDPLDSLHPDDTHIIVGAADSGTLLCYATLRIPPETAPGTTLRDRDRPLLYLEKLFGWGILNRLRILPDLQISRLRQVRSVVKNQLQHTSDELGARAPVEAALAITRVSLGPLRQDIDAIVGEIDEDVVKHNLDYFSIPSVMIHGALAYVTGPRAILYEDWPRNPVASLLSDQGPATRARLDAIEAALELPGVQAIRQLLTLRRDMQIPPSSLWPSTGPQALAAVRLPFREYPMAERRRLFTLAEWLRGIPLFDDLSVAEALVLGTRLQRHTVQTGEHLAPSEGPPDGLLVIVEGLAQVRATFGDGTTVVKALGPGDTFGELALVTGTTEQAHLTGQVHLVAATETTVLQLSGADCRHFLGDLPVVQRRLAEAAARQAVALLAARALPGA